jgi:hypothetical protein
MASRAACQSAWSYGSLKKSAAFPAEIRRYPVVETILVQGRPLAGSRSPSRFS